MALPILAILLGINASAQGKAPPQSSRSHLEEAQRFLGARDLERARQEATMALRLWPQMAEAEDLLGLIDALSGRFEDAKGHFTKALEIQPNLAPAHFNLAKIYLNRGDVQAAKRELETVTRLSPSHARAHYYLGVILRDSKQTQEASSHFEQAQKLEPNNIDLLASLLECQLDLKRQSDAEKTFQRIDHLVNGRDSHLLKLRALLASHGSHALAIVAFQKILSVDPDSYNANYNLGLAYFLSNDNKNAEALLNSLLLRHNVAEVHNLLARVYESTGAYLKALPEYDRAAGMEPSNEDYRFDYCLILVRHRALEHAISQLSRATQDFPKSARLWIALGAACFLKDDYELALQEMLRAIEAEPHLGQSYCYLGKLYEKVGQEPRKIIMEKLKSYLVLNPNDPWAHYFYGVGLFREQQVLEGQNFSAAQAHLQKAIRLKTDHAQAHFSLGMLYEAQGRIADSIIAFQQSSKADPHMHEAHYRLAIAYSRIGNREESEKHRSLEQKLRSESADELAKRRKEFFEIVPTMKPLGPQRN